MPTHEVPATVWKSAEDAVVAGDVATLERILRDYGSMMRAQRPQSWWDNTLAPDYEASDARRIIARTHHFKTFDDFVTFTAATGDKSSAVARFEAAADAIVSGDLVRLRQLLLEDPDLIARARSERITPRCCTTWARTASRDFDSTHRRTQSRLPKSCWPRAPT